jgi:hypothetical protein
MTNGLKNHSGERRPALIKVERAGRPVLRWSSQVVLLGLRPPVTVSGTRICPRGPNLNLHPGTLLGLGSSSVSIQGFPSPLKAIKGYPSLLKGFMEKNYFFHVGFQRRIKNTFFAKRTHLEKLEKTINKGETQPAALFWPKKRTHFLF